MENRDIGAEVSAAGDAIRYIGAMETPCPGCTAKQAQITALLEQIASLNKQVSTRAVKVPTRVARGHEYEPESPKCLGCGKSMRLRRAFGTKALGRESKPFWGCQDYPKCRETRVFHDPSNSTAI